MADSKEEEQLSNTEKRDLVIQAGIQAIPHVGGSLATLYFGRKQELRFKRLETFYKEVAEEIDDLKDRIASPEEHDGEALAAIIEELNEKVEREQVREKREFLKAYLKNTLVYPVKGNYDERRFFLDTLGAMNLLECELLIDLYNNIEPVIVGAIQKPSTDQYAIVGAIGRLKAYGFLVSALPIPAVYGGTTTDFLDELVNISNYGQSFCEFCLGT